MSIRLRLILCIGFFVSAGFYYLTHWILNELKPRYYEAVEDVMVDQVYLLSTIIARDAEGETLDIARLSESLSVLGRRRFHAQVYDLLKTRADLRVYVTDTTGIVRYDSSGDALGKDYSNWRDVARALRGEYGARTTRLRPDDPTSTFFYVAAPIEVNHRVIGAVTISRSTAGITLFLKNARSRFILAGAIAACLVILVGVLASAWVTAPIHRLTRYARAVRDGERVLLPQFKSRELKEMGQALDDMRRALDGKQYVEDYVQTLTHELKSPLAAVQGATELLAEGLPPEKEQLFLNNIALETARMRALIDRMLALSSLESQRGLESPEAVDLEDVCQAVVSRLSAALLKKNIELQCSINHETQKNEGALETNSPHSKMIVYGERFLLEQAMLNLLENAISFAPENSTIHIRCERSDMQVSVIIEDAGPGIPDYAKSRIFDRFYSLARPDTGRKSTGLGLSFVKEIAALHGGSIHLENRAEGGLRAVLRVMVESQGQV